MNADAMRHFVNYHLAENRTLWDSYIVSLSQEHFTQTVNYSRGCVRDQLVHLMSVDNNWFMELRGLVPPEWSNPADFDDRDKLRAEWDRVEQMMRAYLANLTDESLLDKPLQGEDENLIVWQVLLHIVNHGTDHRAQILRILHDFGVKTVSQDYIFYVYDHP